MFLLKMCVSCKRELDFQGLVGLGSVYFVVFWVAIPDNIHTCSQNHLLGGSNEQLTTC